MQALSDTLLAHRILFHRINFGAPTGRLSDVKGHHVGTRQPSLSGLDY